MIRVGNVYRIELGDESSPMARAFIHSIDEAKNETFDEYIVSKLKPPPMGVEITFIANEAGVLTAWYVTAHRDEP